ncbi:MAG: topoisomerase C-terminal repeat-containing protein, partial [Myxococcota bacterium]
WGIRFCLGGVGLCRCFCVRFGFRFKFVDPEQARRVELECFDADLRVGRFGPYLQIQSGEDIKRADVPKEIAPADLKSEHVEQLFADREQGPLYIGIHTTLQQKIFLKRGPYGPYLELEELEPESESNTEAATEPDPTKTETDPPKKKTPKKKNPKKKKPKRVSIPRWLSLSQFHPEAPASLALAMELLTLPRMLGVHPDDQEPIEAGIGRYGSYIKHKSDYRNLSDESTVLRLSLEDALQILKQPKTKGLRGNKVLRELGTMEDGTPLQLCEGRYGPYIKAGKVNATLPREASIDDFTHKQAVALINAKVDTKKATTKKTTKKATTKKDPKKAAATKKATTKKDPKKAAATKKATT